MADAVHSNVSVCGRETNARYAHRHASSALSVAAEVRMQDDYLVRALESMSREYGVQWTSLLCDVIMCKPDSLLQKQF